MPPVTMLGTDASLPFPAASFDDWTFQGVDTAFMESLLRGSAMQPTDDHADKGWDISTFP